MKNLILIIALAFGVMANAQDLSEAIAELQSTGEITTYPIAIGPQDVVGDSFYWNSYDKPRLYDAERKNDTLYLYYKETSMTTYGCLVMNCTQDHSPPVIKYRIPFYAENGKIVKGEKQHPKHVEVKREVIEYKEEW